MIENKKSFIKYRETDFIANKLNNRSLNLIIKNFIFPDPAMVFLKYLRKYEFYNNKKGILGKLSVLYYYTMYRKWSLKTGISIPKNVFAEGLAIPHFGSIVVNPTAKVGKNCMIQSGVNIGANGGSSISPVVGKNVYIGPGAKIYGEIVIADNCYIGANAVVNKSFTEPYSVIVGAPAKVVKIETNVWWQKNRIQLEL